MTRRSGLSLIEVLTALFIMGLGTIAILTMFPLGALQMAQAVRDDRSAQAAAAADAHFRSYWKTRVVEGSVTEPFFVAMTDPNAGLGAGLTHPSPLPSPLPSPQVAPYLYPATLGEPSYPVFIDPMGYVARTGQSQVWVGDSGNTNIPRATMNSVGTNPMLAQRTFSLMDGLGFSEDGVPNPDRELRYNHLLVVQRPRNAGRFKADLTIVVFDRRAHLFAPPGSEEVLSATFVMADPQSGVRPGTTSIRFDSVPSELKAGGWVMDATVGTGPSRIRHANFYRVTAVEGNLVELQSAIKIPSDGNGNSYTGTFVVLRGVSGVFHRPMLTAGD